MVDLVHVCARDYDPKAYLTFPGVWVYKNIDIYVRVHRDPLSLYHSFLGILKVSLVSVCPLKILLKT